MKGKNFKDFFFWYLSISTDFLIEESIKVLNRLGYFLLFLWGKLLMSPNAHASNK